VLGGNVYHNSDACPHGYVQPGFSVQTGAEFSAEIEEIDDCGECASKIRVQNVPEEQDDMTSHRAEMNIESGEIN